MSDFGKFARLVETKFNEMAKGTLYVVDVEKDTLWDKYMESFPEGTNPIFRERREYDCTTCRSFIKNVAGVVTIKDNKLVSIWDVVADGYYNDVALAMSKFVKEQKIKTKYMSAEAGYGVVSNKQVLANGDVLTFNHFHCKLPSTLVNRDFRSVLSVVESNKQVFNRGLNELTVDALETTLELIAQNSLYRGSEFKDGINGFLKSKRAYDKLTNETEKDIFVWSNVESKGSRIRNTAIGTLLQDLSEGRDLESAVKAYEQVVAPANYKRPTALVTESMIKRALETIDNLGIEPALYRRHAVLEDISVADVLYADRTASTKMQGVAGLLKGEVKVSTKSLGKIEEIGIDDFIANVLPTCTSLEVLLENKHSSNFCNLVAPMDTTAKGIFKWGSNFSWSYNGNIADSMKQNVKNAGGNVEGCLRFSIQWNDNNNNGNDLDAHCIQPNGREIYYGDKNGGMSGTLDVDIINPGSKVAVENIIYTDISRMKDGKYEFFVINFNGSSGRNFTAEIEFDGVTHSYSYEGLTKGKMPVATVTKKGNTFTIDHKMKSSESAKEIYGLKTQQFHKVNLVTLSPNFWDEKSIGNKHFMFILEGCKNPEPVRGFYNEFLDDSLNEHRKVFEVLASKMQCPYEEEQLAGLGFSSTQRNELTVKVQGSFTRTLKIKF